MKLHRGLLREYAIGLSVLTRSIDVSTCIIAAVLTYRMRFGSFAIFSHTDYLVLIFIGAILVLVVFPLTGLYQSWRPYSWRAPAARALAAWVIVCVLLLVLLVMVKRSEHFSREWLAEWFGLQAVLLVLIRFAVFTGLHWLRRRGYNQRNVVLVGNSARVKALAGQAMLPVSMGFSVVAMFSTGEAALEIDGNRFRPLRELRDYLLRRIVDEVWIALPLGHGHKLAEVVAQCDGIAANVRYVPDLHDMYLLNHGVTEIYGTPMIDLRASPMQGSNRLLKALEDRMLAGLILVLVSPLMVLIAIGVRLSSPGPVFYLQKRIGWNGRSFTMLKFRSMPSNAEAGTGAVWARKNDSRATAFGGFLRRTSLDELPQFLNVLVGDMSIVGPRPERPEFVQKFRSEIPNYMQKHLVKAGITGWAQVNGWRGNTDLNKRVEYDLYYINNWSVWFDFKIIFLTLFKGFVNRNAY